MPNILYPALCAGYQVNDVPTIAVNAVFSCKSGLVSNIRVSYARRERYLCIVKKLVYVYLHYN